MADEYPLSSTAVDIVTGEMERRAVAEEFYNSPVLWANYMLNETLWSKQREVSESVVREKSTAVKAGHGVGKSWLAAVLVCWWIDTRYPNVFVASTAPSTAQINAILWREIRKMKAIIEKRHAKYKELVRAGRDASGYPDHELPGYITADAQWKVSGGQVVGFGRKPPDNKEDDAFQGLHDAAVLAIGDEACGLTGDLIDALGNITSNDASRRLLIANPTNPNSYFGHIFKVPSGAWSLHTISVLESPNFTDEKYEMSQEALEKLTGAQYVEDKRLEYGEDSARYKARILGEFAQDDENTLISQGDIDLASAAEIEPGRDQRPSLGVDVARMGGDSTTVFSNHNGRIRLVEKWNGAYTTETASRVHRIAVDLAAEVVYVDSDGVGGGVRDQLAALADGAYTVVEVHGAAASPDSRQWHNFRAWAWDMFRARCRSQEIDLDPGDTDLHDELLSVRYKFNGTTGGLLIESKDDMRKRGMHSPDLADGAVYASLAFDLDDPLLAFKPGDKVSTTAQDILDDDMPQYLTMLTAL